MRIGDLALVEKQNAEAPGLLTGRAFISTDPNAI
jgi:hypothetical protein